MHVWYLLLFNSGALQTALMLFCDEADGHLLLKHSCFWWVIYAASCGWFSHPPGHGIIPPEVFMPPLYLNGVEMKCVCVKCNTIICGGFYLLLGMMENERTRGMKI